MVDNLTDPDNSDDAERTTRIATIPNLLCLIRLLGSFVLVGIAINGSSEHFLWLFIALTMTDWVDGKLAILLNQRSVLGARLDSWADAALYAALLAGALLLHAEILVAEIEWILPAVASYALSTLAGFWKFRRWPSYHTRAAKTSWLLILIGSVCLFGGWSLWPLRIALAGILLTNIEALLITILSARWQADVGSVFRVLRARKEC
jgi:CDP-diacylglycerol--glycerol-3-phosphate 3-phosphatidyltransferase